MKFLVDAQLPHYLCKWLRESGHDAVHTRDLLLGNCTPDSEIIRIADSEERVVVTKDSDFVDSCLLRNQPERLLLIATGNIRNTELMRLIMKVLPAVLDAFEKARYIEINHQLMVIHE
jgi:predicted nuclease of predicted toxin-antitoxin system